MTVFTVEVKTLRVEHLFNLSDLLVKFWLHFKLIFSHLKRLTLYDFEKIIWLLTESSLKIMIKVIDHMNLYTEKVAWFEFERLRVPNKKQLTWQFRSIHHSILVIFNATFWPVLFAFLAGPNFFKVRYYVISSEKRQKKDF